MGGSPVGAGNAGGCLAGATHHSGCGRRSRRAERNLRQHEALFRISSSLDELLPVLSRQTQ